MKKNIKIVTALILIMSMLLSLTSCVSTDVKTAGKEIMDNLFEGKISKVEKALDRSDDDYELHCAILETFFEYYNEDALDFLFDDYVEFKKEDVKVKGDKGSIDYVLEIQGEEYDFELNLKYKGKNWKIRDNEEFIKSVFELILVVGVEEGNDLFQDVYSASAYVEGTSDPVKLAKKTYDVYETISIHSPGYVEPVVVETTEPSETEPFEPAPYSPSDPGREVMSMFIAYPGTEIYDDNDICNLIADKIDVYVDETYLFGQTSAEAVGSIIASGSLPDFIDGGDSMMLLYDAGVLIPWDDYIEMYPNIKALYTDEEWDMFRQDDGHIYWANVFNRTYGEDKSTGHNGQAFWIQARVLEWAGYPNITTLDEYFEILKGYADANPTMPDGTPVIPYTALCDDWRYYCLELAPMFLDGYPNNGSVIVNTTDYDKPTIVDYNTTPTAKLYFQKLNEMYLEGYMDIDFATQTYDEYISKLCTGRVLGMCDQYWDFAYTVAGPFAQQGLDELGCEYVPLGLVMEEGQSQQWHSYVNAINTYSGIAVTTACFYPDLAFSFLNEILGQDIHDLRFWGIEGVDYLVDADGSYYRTEEMRANWANQDYKLSHCCEFAYMPQWNGTSRDGINAMKPQEQTSEFYATLSTPMSNCFEAYDVSGYAEMIGSDKDADPGVWFPMYSYSNMMTSSTAGGVAFYRMGECKHQWLPTIVMSSNFEAEWQNYMDAYEECNPQAFIEEMQEELDRRVEFG